MTGFDAPDPVVFINTPAEKLLLVPVMEKGRAINETYKNVNVLSYSDINLSSKTKPSISNYILKILKNKKIKKIKIDKDFPVEIYKALIKTVHIDVAELSVKKDRRKKSTNEIKALSYCQKITSNAMRLAIKIIEKSTIDNDGSLVLNKKKL